MSEDKVTPKPSGFTIKDSGNRHDFGTGAVRDIQVGKGRPDLLPVDVILRMSEFFEAGCQKYGRFLPITGCGSCKKLVESCSCKNKQDVIQINRITAEESVVPVMKMNSGRETQSSPNDRDKIQGNGLKKISKKREKKTKNGEVDQFTKISEKSPDENESGRDSTLPWMTMKELSETGALYVGKPPVLADLTSIMTTKQCCLAGFFAPNATKGLACLEILQLYLQKHLSTCVIHHYRIEKMFGMTVVGTERNWELGIPLATYYNSMTRHSLKLLRGDVDEDHAIACLWNIACFIQTKEWIKQGVLPSYLNNMPKAKQNANPSKS